MSNILTYCQIFVWEDWKSGLVNSRTQNPTATVWTGIETSQHIQLGVTRLQQKEMWILKLIEWSAHLSVEIIDGESDEEDENGDKGDRHSSVTNVDRKVGQLGLQGELF